MKSLRFFFFTALVLMSFLGCTRTEPGVANPPEFVEMYLNEPEELLGSHQFDPMDRLIRLSEAPLIDLEYDAVLDSETDFEVVVVTNGVNYDLLYSVELNDSLLGNCIYTDQSTLYAASSTIIVEDDGTYTTQVILTIPGSTEHTTYLSERTITLSKILFTRDTANGTFPADIPENTTTSLLFEVHSLHYFDETLGLPFSVNQGKVDIILTPDSPYFAQAQTLAKSILTIPATFNDYPIGTVVLTDINWITELNVLGASQDVFLLGDFAALTDLTLDGLSYVSLFDYREITINGSFPALKNITVANSVGYRFFLAHNFVTDDQRYLDYIESSGATPYDFPVLETIEIENCRFDPVQIGNDEYHLPFPSLTTLTVTNSYIVVFDFGDETNAFPKLEAVEMENTSLAEAQFAGNKAPEESPATLTLNGVSMDFTFLVQGSLFSTIAFIDSSLSGIRIEGGTIYDSVFSGISFTNTVFPDNGGTFYLYGSHPELVQLVLEDVSISQIKIGNVGSEFAQLQQIMLSGIEGWSIDIGERDGVFSELHSIIIHDVTLGGSLNVGQAEYPSLVEIAFRSIEANNLTIGYFGGDFSALTTIVLEHLTITSSLTVGGGVYPLLTAMEVSNVTSGAANFYPQSATYEIYFYNFLATSVWTVQVPGCQKIYVPLADVTTWVYYDYAFDLGIVIETGSWLSPE